MNNPKSVYTEFRFGIFKLNSRWRFCSYVPMVWSHFVNVVIAHYQGDPSMRSLSLSSLLADGFGRHAHSVGMTCMGEEAAGIKGSI